jgi:hypothetical protein
MSQPRTFARGRFIFLTRNKQKRFAKKMASKLAKARRARQGLRLQDWRIDALSPEQLTETVETLIVWCRDTLAGCRRPYGIDGFELTLSVQRPGDKKAQSLTFNDLRPLDLYQEPLQEKIRLGLLRLVGPERAGLHLSAGFFSWGEAAFKALGET